MSDSAPTAAPASSTPATPPPTNGAAKAAVQKPVTPAPAQATPPVEKPATPPPEPEDPWVGALKAKPIKVRNRAGKEVTVESPTQLMHYISKGFGSSQAMQEASEKEARLAPLLQLLERRGTDPKGVMLELFGEEAAAKLAYEITLSRYEEDMKLREVPEHIRAELMEAKRNSLQLKKVQETQQQYQQRQAEQQRQQELADARDMLLTDGVKALQAAGFPEKTPHSAVYRLGPYLAEATELGLGPEHAAELYREDTQKELGAIAKAFVEGKDGKGLTAWLGDDVVDLLLRHRLATLRGPVATAAAVERPATPKQPERKQMTREELKAFLKG